MCPSELVNVQLHFTLFPFFSEKSTLFPLILFILTDISIIQQHDICLSACNLTHPERHNRFGTFCFVTFFLASGWFLAKEIRFSGNQKTRFSATFFLYTKYFSQKSLNLLLKNVGNRFSSVLERCRRDRVISKSR